MLKHLRRSYTDNDQVVFLLTVYVCHGLFYAFQYDALVCLVLFLFSFQVNGPMKQIL